MEIAKTNYNNNKNLLEKIFKKKKMFNNNNNKFNNKIIKKMINNTYSNNNKEWNLILFLTSKIKMLNLKSLIQKDKKVKTSLKKNKNNNKVNNYIIFKSIFIYNIYLNLIFI